MKKLLQKRLKNEKGLTLVELLAVIVILGIIAAIAVPAIGGIIENSRVKAIKADALNALSAADLYFIDKEIKEDDKPSVKVSELVSSGYLDNAGAFETDEDAAVTISATDSKTIKAFSGSGTNSSVSLEFTNATKEDINKATEVKSGGAIPPKEQ
ncbi:prepilin-type N-terminal cleavage/methylation domain-containing protein [Sporosarcina sp. Marseille-Q4943]|uniref:prepilin-type N-terminal cleavage/methylation domain-containing protein n=1 Tax=Sporosarcina sp. Marseille-Q4943 TaxID=2942204 RepID=UPI00208DA7F5|nr:prepilin-type N-terminal cleavage/methylation domain-containing protein [Sporosarcina sp. Marseille-Q4943]